MNTIVRTTAILLFALLPLSPAAFASDRHHGGDRHHGHPGYYDRHHQQHYYRHHHRHGWHRYHGHHHGVRYGYTGVRVVIPAPPLPVIVPPHVVLHKAR